MDFRKRHVRWRKKIARVVLKEIGIFFYMPKNRFLGLIGKKTFQGAHIFEENYRIREKQLPLYPHINSDNKDHPVCPRPNRGEPRDKGPP